MPQYAEKVIHTHVRKYKKHPIFMYLPFQDVHSPLQVPEKYLKLYPNITNKARRIYSGMYNLDILKANLYIISLSSFS